MGMLPGLLLLALAAGLAARAGSLMGTGAGEPAPDTAQSRATAALAVAFLATAAAAVGAAELSSGQLSPAGLAPFAVGVLAVVVPLVVTATRGRRGGHRRARRPRAVPGGWHPFRRLAGR